MTGPTVSVLMTAYNREQYISGAIESVLASVYTDFELLIFDDASSDNTVAIANRYLYDKRVTVQVNDKNLGDYPNRNHAVRHARGKYVMFCDSDDEFFKDSIGYCVEAMEANPGCSFGIYYAQPAPAPFVMSSPEILQHHFFQQPLLIMGPGGTIFSRSFFETIGGYPVKYGPANDMYFNLKAASKTAVLLLPKLFIYYREHAAQENKNLYAYVHYNYSYLRDALSELNLHLSSEQAAFISKKNKRRFVRNCITQLKERKSIAAVKTLWQKTGFRFKDMLQGIFH